MSRRHQKTSKPATGAEIAATGRTISIGGPADSALIGYPGLLAAAPEVAEHLVAAIRQPYDLIVVNFANPDMVGHTGDLDAAIKACEAVDTGLGLALAALEDVGGAIVVTADHGNCETMVDPETGGPHTAHTTNLVPVIVKGGPDGTRLRDGRLADLAPTVLGLMGLDLPPEMTGRSLIEAG